jgi:hypothetical protein
MHRLARILLAALVLGCTAATPTVAPSTTPGATAPNGGSASTPSDGGTPPPTSAPTSEPTPAQPDTPATTAESSPVTTADGLALARADLDNLLAQLELTHPEPFHGIRREDWVAELDALKERLPELSPFEAQVQLQRVVTLLSVNGRDGHQFALPLDDAPALPIAVYEFEEGVFITAALAPHQDVVGSEIVAVNGHPIADVLAALEPLIPRDGPATVPGFRPIYFARTSVLRGLGLIEEGTVPMRLRDSAGAERDVDLEPVPFSQYTGMVGQYGVGLPPNGSLYLTDPDRVIWSQDLPDSNTFYIRYRMIGSIDSGALQDIEDGATAPGVERVILDLRQNPGGDNNRYVGLLTLLTDERINQPGRLFVLTDRRTFSAASNLSTEVEQKTAATFAGEPMGGGLNFWNDVRQVELPHYSVPMWVGVSTRYWQKSTADDPRLTIEPDLPFDVTAADYFAGIDPVMEAITAR